MFRVKIERSKNWLRIATRPSATTIEIEREQHRHETRHDRAEDDQQDEQGRGKPELQLALLEVVLRELHEVVVIRPLTGDRGFEVVLVRTLDRLDDALHVGLRRPGAGRR